MKRILLSCVIAGLVVAIPVFAGDTAQKPAMMGHEGHMMMAPEGTTCPVDGKKVANMDRHAGYGGIDFYFDSDACLAAFEKDPGEYAVAVCPVMGHAIKMKDAAAKTVYDGKTYYFCSVSMKDDFEKNPEKYATFACPVSGEVMTYAEAGATLQYEGETVRFCCNKCVKAFKADPEKYMMQSNAGAKAEGQAHTH